MRWWASPSEIVADTGRLPPAGRAPQLLHLLAPTLEEREDPAIEGIGWGLKTIGRYHPQLLLVWLRRQLTQRRPRGLMVRKAVTYLPQEYKAEFA